MIGTTTKRREPCQVGSETDHPCPHRAMVEIEGVPFCETCAREQEAYFAVGRLVTHAQEDRESDREAMARGRVRREESERASRGATWDRFVQTELRELELRKDGQFVGVLDRMRGSTLVAGRRRAGRADELREGLLQATRHSHPGGRPREGGRQQGAHDVAR